MWGYLRIEIPGEDCTSLPRVMFCSPALRCLMGRTEGQNGSFFKPSIFFIFHDPLVDLGAACYVHMWYICYYYCIAGHSLGALMHLKTKTLNDVHLRSFVQLLQKVQVSG